MANMAANQTSLIMRISNSRLTDRSRELNFGTQGVLWDRIFFANMAANHTSLIMRISNSRLTDPLRELNFGTQGVLWDRIFLPIWQPTTPH